MTACAHHRLEDTKGTTGLGSSPFSTGGQFSSAQANAMNNAINANAEDIAALQEYTDAVTGAEPYGLALLTLEGQTGLVALLPSYQPASAVLTNAAGAASAGTLKYWGTDGLGDYGFYDLPTVEGGSDTDPVYTTVTADAFISSAADGAHHGDVANTSAISVDPTLGRYAWYDSEMRVADGSDWNDYFLRYDHLGANVFTFLETPTGANLAAALSTALPDSKGGTGLTALGTGVATALGNNTDAASGLATYSHTVQYSATPVVGDPDNFAANFTGGNLYGGTFIANAAGTAALPDPAVGMNFTYVMEGANANIIDPLGTGTADTITMNGLAAAQDENITSSTSGAMCVFQYRAANSWMATCTGWEEATPP